MMPPPTAILSRVERDGEVHEVEAQLIDELVERRGKRLVARLRRRDVGGTEVEPGLALRDTAPRAIPLTACSSRTRSAGIAARDRRAAEAVADLAGGAVLVRQSRGPHKQCRRASRLRGPNRSPGRRRRAAPDRASAAAAALTSVMSRTTSHRRPLSMARRRSSSTPPRDRDGEQDPPGDWDSDVDAPTATRSPSSPAWSRSVLATSRPASRFQRAREQGSSSMVSSARRRPLRSATAAAILVPPKSSPRTSGTLTYTPTNVSRARIVRGIE